MPKLTSVASTQKKFERYQGRVVGEQIFENSRNFRKMSKTVDSTYVIHSNACSFATEHSCSAHNSVARALVHTHTHTLLRTHAHIHNETPNTTPHPWLRAHTIRETITTFPCFAVLRLFAFQRCSFANKDGVHVQAFGRPSLQAIRAETMVDGLPRASKCGL